MAKTFLLSQSYVRTRVCEGTAFRTWLGRRMGPKTNSKARNATKNSVGDDFSNEMITWYNNNAQGNNEKSGKNHPGNPATLV